MKNILKLLVALAALSLCACVSLRSYRTAPPYGPVEEFRDRDGNLLHIGFVELDDHGLYWTDKELPASMQMIADAAKPNGAIVAVFVHGWENNARYPDDINSDLDSFKSSVLAVMSQHETAAAARENRPRRNVAGVYVAWRGKSLRGLLFPFSFYDRKEAALRVADTQATATLRSLIAKTRENPHSQIIVIGHSFGGLITERALGPVLVTEAMRLRTGGPPQLLREAPDLVILVNPATNATRALGDVWTLRNSPEIVPRRPTPFYGGRQAVSRTPLIVSLTSETSLATGIAFPAAEYLDSMFQRFRGWGGTPMDGVFPSERMVYAKTMGHLSQIWSHNVTFRQLAQARTDPQREPAKPCTKAEAAGGEICFIVGRDMFILTPRDPRFNDTHYWIMQVPKSIINGHSDVWNPVWVNMLIGMMEALG